MNSERIQSAGETLLRAFVSMEAGNGQKAFRLFASLKEDEGFHAIMDGVAKAVLKLRASEDEDNLDDFEDVSDDEEADAMDDEDMPEDDDEEIEVPASVAQVLGYVED